MDNAQGYQGYQGYRGFQGYLRYLGYQGYQGNQGYPKYRVCQGSNGLEVFEVFDDDERTENKMSEKGEEVYISEGEVTEPTEECEEKYFDETTALEKQATDFPNKDNNPPEKSENTAFLDSVFGELPPKSIIKANLLFAKPAHPNRRAKSNNRASTVLKKLKHDPDLRKPRLCNQHHLMIVDNVTSHASWSSVPLK